MPDTPRVFPTIIPASAVVLLRHETLRTTLEMDSTLTSSRIGFESEFSLESSDPSTSFGTGGS